MTAVNLLAGLGAENSVTPAPHVALVVPADGTDLGFATRAVSFAGAGDIKVTTVGGETLVIPSGALVAGIMHPLQLVRIWSTGTTATGIVAYW